MKDALINKWYKKLQIIFDNAPVEIDDNLDLKSSFFISDEKIIVVRPQDIEENSKLIISKKAGRYTYLHDKYDLIVTNAFNAGIEANELCIIYFRDFYKEPKMKTLSIKFTDKEILLSNEIDKIYNSDSIDKLNNVSSIINSQESSIILEVPNSGDINARGELDRTLLHLASEAGEFDKVKLLLDRGANIEVQDKFGYTPIFLATQSGKWSVVELLLDRGANIDAQDEKGQTLLHFAASGNNLDMVQFLLNRGANIEVQDKFAWTPILSAAQSGKWDVVKLLISNGAKFNNEITYQGTPLHFAVQEGNLDMVRFLLDEGADIESQDKDNKKPLHLAVDTNRLSVVKLLLDRGASVNAKDENNKTPLDLATEEDMIEILKKAQLDQGLLINARNGNLDKVKDLIAQDANLETKDNNDNTPLHNACNNDHLKVVEYLIEKGASLKAKNKDGKTPLDLAIQKGHTDIVQMIKQIQSDLNEKLLSAVKSSDLNKVEDLISQGASLEVKDSNGNTLLHYASQNNHLEVVEYLIKKGASLKAKNKDGETPLELAVQKNYIGIIEFLKKTQLDLDEELLATVKGNDLNKVKALVSQGASLEAKDNSDNTPLHNACNNGHVKVVEYLIKEGASLKAKNKDGEAPLHVAVQHDGTLEVIEFILNRDLSGINDITNDGRTPLHLAIQGNKPNTVELLLRKGASIAVKDKNGKTPLDLAKQEDYTNIVEMIEEVQLALDEKLLTAVQNGNLNEVEGLVSQNANVNTTDIYSWTPLHWAAFKDHLEIAEFLIEKNADIHAADKGPYGKKPIHVATENGNKDIVELLLGRRVGVDDTDNQGYTPLYYAVLRRRLEVADLLINEKANVNSAIKGTDGKTLLHFIVEKGDMGMVEIFLRGGANIEVKDTDEWTPIYSAASYNKLNIVEFLFNNGANINTKDKYGNTLLHVAARYSSELRIVEFFLDKNTNNMRSVNNIGRTPLHEAVEGNKLNTVKFLLGRGADIEVQDIFGETPLVMAIQKGYTDIVKALEQEQLGKELFTAVREFSLPRVEELISRGANVDTKNKNGKTPLDVAINTKNVLEEDHESLNNSLLLTQQGHIVRVLEQEQLRRKLFTAVREENLPKVRELIGQGADVDAKKDGKTPLDIAKEKLRERGKNEECSDIVQCLEKLNQKRGEAVQRKRRHLLSESLGSSNQPEVAASSGTRPSSWINDLFGWVRDSVGGLFGSRVALPEETLNTTTQNSISQIDAPIDVNGTIMLLDVLIRKVTGQKYISSADQPTSLLEAQGYALNITKGFGKVVEQAARDSKISIHRLDIDYMGMQKEITRKVMSGKFNEISGILKSYVEKACPGEEAGKLSPKKFEKFIAQFNKGLLNQSIEQILHNRDGRLEVDGTKKQQMSLEPQSYLSNASVHSHSEVSTCLSEIGVTKLGGNINR